MSTQKIPTERICIHQSTLMQCDFKPSIDCLARNDVKQTAVWMEKLDEVGLKQANSILRDAGVEAISYCASGLFAGLEEKALERQIDECRRRIGEASEIGASSIVMITGGLPEGSKDLQAARKRSKSALNRLTQDAADAGIKIALEPLHPMVCGFRSVISTLDEAMELIRDIEMPDAIGFALDTYALWWDDGLKNAIKLAGGKIINFHVSDWLADTKDIRLDRGMPGDGLIDIRSIRSELESCGFNGAIEVEVLSKDHWWKCDPDEVVKTAVDSVKKFV